MKNRGRQNISNIKNETIRYAILAAIVAEAISIPIFGANVRFPYGLAIGTCAAIAGISVISVSVERALASGSRSPVTVGLIVRILLYGGALMAAARTSGVSGAGAAVGLLLPRVALFVRFHLIPALRRKRKDRKER